MKNLAIAIGLVALVSSAVLAQSGNDMFQQALVKQNTERNLPEAIKIYQTIIQKYGSDRKLVAKALFQMGQAYEKLGNTEAQKAYNRIVKEFGEQKDLVDDANRRLAALSVPPTSDKFAPRLVFSPDKYDDESISPDGRSMAVTIWGGKDGGDNELLIRDMSTGQLKRLLAASCGSPCVMSESPVLSPDARQVAFTWYDPAEIGGVGQLRVMAPEAGAKPRVLVRDREFGIWASAWFPDGKSILVSMRKSDRNDPTWQIGKVSVADGSIKVLKSLEWRQPRLSLSPDGRYIAYSALAMNPSKPGLPVATDPTDKHIYILAADGSSPVEVVKTAGVNRDPVWMPDGKHLLFISDLSSSSDLWAVPVREGSASGSPSLVRKGIGAISPIGMTRSGSYYYGTQRESDDVEQISIAELTPGGAARITDRFVGLSPTWLSDGKSIGFLRHSANGNYMVTRSIDAGDEKIYARAHSQINGVPAKWFHDGSGFLHDGHEKQSDPVSVYFIGKENEEFKQVYTAPDGNRGVDFAISLDDKTLYLFTGDPKSWNTNRGLLDRIIAFDINSKQSKTVLRLPGTADTLPWPREAGMALSPDGRALAFTTINPKTKQARLAVVRIDGSDYREIYSPFSANVSANGGFVSKLAWTKDGRAIVFAATADNASSAWQIMRIGIEGGKPELMGLVVKDLRTFSLSPDGSRIAFDTMTAQTKTAELWAIDNLPALLKDSQ